jgi:protein SCO1/2
VCLSALAVAQQGGLYHGPDKLSQPSDGTPKVLREIGIDQRLNEQVPLDIEFRDESGEMIQLNRYIKDKPVIIALVYYQPGVGTSHAFIRCRKRIRSRHC